MNRASYQGDPFYPHAQPRVHPQLILLLIFVLPVALIPSTRGTFVNLPFLPPLWWTVYALFVFSLCVFVWRGLVSSLAPDRRTMLHFLAPAALLAVWQCVSLAWNGQDMDLRRYSFIQTAGMMGALSTGALLCSGLPWSARLRVARGVTLMVVFVIAIYAGLSFFHPGLRPSEAWMDRTSEGLGFTRVFGPLGTATTLNFILLPSLGFSFGMAAGYALHRVTWTIVTVFLFLCILATGSRMGILGIACFALVTSLFERGLALKLLVPLGILIVFGIAVLGVPERFQSFQDESRATTYRTAMAAYRADVRHLALGTGHGAMYSKLHDDTMRKLYGRDRWYLLSHETPFGRSLRNSHSAIIRALVETGPIGLMLTMWPLVWVATRAWSSSVRVVPRLERLHLRSMLAGCVATMPLMAVEEYFISAFWIVLLWTVFAVTAAEGIGSVGTFPEKRLISQSTG